MLSQSVTKFLFRFDPNGLDDVKSCVSEFAAVHNLDNWNTEMSGPLLEQIHQIVPNRPYRICIAVRNPDGGSFNSPDMALPPPKIHARGPLPTEVSATATPSVSFVLCFSSDCLRKRNVK